jgi:hypothetical protein
MLLCTRCGKENADEARSCTSCGARFGGQDESTPFVTTGLDERKTQPLRQDARTRDELERLSPAPRGAGVEKRDPLLVLILGFVTCYIYLFYWWYATASDIKRATKRTDINPPLDLVLNILTCGLYTIYLSYKYPKLVLEMQEKAGVTRNDTTLLSVLLSLFSLGPIACYVIQADLNRIWDTLEFKKS